MNLEIPKYRQVLLWGIKTLIFVTPFLSFWIANSFYFPYITGRNFVFRVLIELAFALWLGLITLDKSYRPRWTWLTKAVLIFLVVIGIANFLGVNPYKSFWSSYERMEGYMMILHLSAYFFILTSVFRAKKEWFTLANLFVIAGILLVGGYGILQIVGLKEAIQGGDVRIDGTIGNPTYLAAYMTLIAAVSSLLFFNVSYKLKYFYGAAVIYSFFILYFTASRGAAVSLLIAIPLFAVLYLWFFKGQNDREKIYKRIAIVGLILMILAPLSLWLLKGTRFVKDSPTLERLTSISLNDRTTKSRFLIWNIAWQGFKERPILGWGQDNFITVFSKHYSPALYNQEPWFDRPHNIIFEWLINGGVFGLLSYIGLFAALYSSIIFLLRSGAVSKKEGLILLVTPIAYFIQNLLVFDNFNTYVIFFGLLAYVNSRYVETTAVIPAKTATRRDIFQISLGVTVGALIVMLMVAYFGNVRPARQAKQIIQALISTNDQTDAAGKTYTAFKTALNFNTFGTNETLEQLARITKTLIDQTGESVAIKEKFLQLAASETERQLQRFPNDIRLRLFLGDIYQSAAQISPNYLSNAREHFKTALELSPRKQQILFVLANNYLINSEVEKAIEILQQAVDLEPSYLVAHGNKGLVGALIGRTDLVQQAITAMVSLWERGVDGANTSEYRDQLLRIADAYVRRDQYRNAAVIYEQVVKIEPDNEEYRATLEDLKTKLSRGAK